MGEATGGRLDGRAVGRSDGRTIAGAPELTARPADRPLCNRCGFPVPSRAFGCKNPCLNCGTVYPLGDCSD